MVEAEQKVDHTKDGQADSDFILAAVSLVRFDYDYDYMMTETKTWTSPDSGSEPVADFCEHGNEQMASMKGNKLKLL